MNESTNTDYVAFLEQYIPPYWEDCEFVDNPKLYRP